MRERRVEDPALDRDGDVRRRWIGQPGEGFAQLRLGARVLSAFTAGVSSLEVGAATAREGEPSGMRTVVLQELGLRAGPRRWPPLFDCAAGRDRHVDSVPRRGNGVTAARAEVLRYSRSRSPGQPASTGARAEFGYDRAVRFRTRRSRRASRDSRSPSEQPPRHESAWCPARTGLSCPCALTLRSFRGP
jgi:hypothetical protein